MLTMIIHHQSNTENVSPAINHCTCESTNRTGYKSLDNIKNVIYQIKFSEKNN